VILVLGRGVSAIPSPVLPRRCDIGEKQLGVVVALAPFADQEAPSVQSGARDRGQTCRGNQDDEPAVVVEHTVGGLLLAGVLLCDHRSRRVEDFGGVGGHPDFDAAGVSVESGQHGVPVDFSEAQFAEVVLVTAMGVAPGEPQLVLVQGCQVERSVMVLGSTRYMVTPWKASFVPRSKELAAMFLASKSKH
jgi:hypothetical protein